MTRATPLRVVPIGKSNYASLSSSRSIFKTLRKTMARSDCSLLRAPNKTEYPTLERVHAPYARLTNFELDKKGDQRYQQQYGDMYFLRLAKLKPAVERIAADAWEGYQIAGDTVHRVERVLDVRQGELCWVAGTVYMDMPLKPNILDDISKDHWIAAPPPREKYLSPSGQDKVMLEDESGRLRLIGVPLQSELLVTGCIIAVMGTENANGDFEVIDIKVPDLPRQPERWGLGKKSNSKSNGDARDDLPGNGKVAILSGLAITGDSGDSLALDLLLEWLLGELTSSATQADAVQISRLVIAGNSLAEASPTPARDDNVSAALSNGKRAAATKKYGYDSSAYNPAPTAQLDLLLSTLLPSLPVTLISGASDPANVSLPQQPLHPALFPRSRGYASGPPTAGAHKKGSAQDDTHPFHPATNPAFFTIAGQLFLGTGGQPIDDIAKYVDSAEPLDLLEQTLRWRLLAPTAPDTLWCYPYQSDEPFVLQDGQCPHVYFVGNQETFGTRLVEGPEGQRVRCISVPRFAETGEVVLVDLSTLEVEVVKFDIFNGQMHDRL